METSETQIKQTIVDLKKRLSEPGMNKPVNRAIKEGYTEVVRILVEDIKNYELISDSLKTVQGRAIAIIAVDYLRGECTKKVLIGVHLRV